MQCARLNLQVRSKPITRHPPKIDKPRRYCQKRMVNPEHSEDPRWTDVLRRFHCNANTNFDKYVYAYENDNNSAGQEDDMVLTVQNNSAGQEDDMVLTVQNNSAGQEDDMVLTVQNLKFQGNVLERKRPRTSFKYKSLTGNRKHRMFIRQVVDEISNCEEDLSSELTNYYFDDYVKYILNNDRSRPSSSKSSIFLQDLSNKYRETKSTQVEKKQIEEPKKIRKSDVKVKKAVNKHKNDSKKETDDNNAEDLMQNTKVTFQKTGKRKSLTISRAQSPETIQVIRVDVVCNYSTSSMMSDYEEDKRQSSDNLDEKDVEKNIDKIKYKTPHFADKYLLTNTIKSVNENLSCGSKVTLLCKTFKLSDRSKLTEKKYNKFPKDPPKMCVRKMVK